MNSTPESEFDWWWDSLFGSTGELDLESDVDECLEDRFDDPPAR